MGWTAEGAAAFASAATTGDCNENMPQVSLFWLRTYVSLVGLQCLVRGPPASYDHLTTLLNFQGQIWESELPFVEMGCIETVLFPA